MLSELRERHTQYEFTYMWNLSKEIEPEEDQIELTSHSHIYLIKCVECL